MKTTVATTTAELEAPAAVRDVLKFKPANMRLDWSGHVSQRYHIDATQGMIPEDARTTEAWADVQKSSRFFLKLDDEVIITAPDRSWREEGFVVDLDNSGVDLHITKVIAMKSRLGGKLLETPEYKLERVGIAGFCVVRKWDGARVTSPVYSLALAERDLANQYPRRA